MRAAFVSRCVRAGPAGSKTNITAVRAQPVTDGPHPIVQFAQVLCGFRAGPELVVIKLIFIPGTVMIASLKTCFLAIIGTASVENRGKS